MANVGVNRNKKKKIVVSLLVLKELIESSSPDSKEDLDTLTNIEIAYRRKIPRMN